MFQSDVVGQCQPTFVSGRNVREKSGSGHLALTGCKLLPDEDDGCIKDNNDEGLLCFGAGTSLADI